MVEVIMSSVIVAAMVVATLTGFGVVDRTTTDQRQHNDAAVLAGESQEELRSDPASTFNTPGNKFEHVYKQTLGKTTFTITQKASYLNATGESTSCSATEPKRQDTNSLKITSLVTWATLKARGRNEVVQSSTITPPTGSALEVDVGNQNAPTAGISGVGVTAKYHPNESTSTSTLSGTTESGGCVVFGAIPATAAVVEIAEKSGLVTPTGATLVQPKEVAIAPNLTTHYPVTLNEGGAIMAEFQYEKKNEREVLNNGSTAKIKQTVTGDTFVAENEAMEEAEFETGSTVKNSFTGGLFTVVPGTYEHTATSPKEEIKYPRGNLFPFITPEWKVYAGDCPENNPTTATAAVQPSKATVSPGLTKAVPVPMAYVAVSVYTGNAAPGPFEETTAWPVVFKNTACKAVTPNNETAFSELRREQKTTTNALTPKFGGHLSAPFQPFGATSMCLAYNNTPTSNHKTFTVALNLKAEGEYPVNVKLGAPAGTYEETLEQKPSGVKEKVKVKVVSQGSTISCP